jgi:3D (Asp-Asp-Asp) domain-containing protein
MTYKQMIRYFYSSLFLFVGMGLPLLAKNTPTGKLVPPVSSKTGTKSIPAPASPSVTHAKADSPKKLVTVVTSDRSRADIAASAASLQQPAPAATAKVVAKTAPAKPSRHVEPKGGEPSVLVTRTSPSKGNASPVTPVLTEAEPGHSASGERLARVTAYWAAEGDYYTGRCISSTGIRLHDGHCAVDPNIIPYGSVVEIAGVGKFLAVDTGSAVISRTAAREGGHTSAERHAIVVDVFFANRREGEQFAAGAAKYVSITWWTPSSKTARDLFAEEDWTKIQSKQL